MPEHDAPHSTPVADALRDLPVADALPALTAALRQRANAVLVAPPGAGKTTLVPLVLKDESWAQGGKILVLEPRRVAARAAAARMASLLGERAGETIGITTRLDRAVSEATRVEVVTEGLLVRRLQSDPGLDGVVAVLFDEAHERNLDTDLALALCLDMQAGLRPDLRLLAMSATLDARAFAALMGDAPVIESLGRAWPVTVRHRAREIADPRDLPDAMAGAIREALAEQEGDVLAFLPGWGEIRRVQERLSGIAAEVLPLHGDLPPAEQDRALSPGTRRRVVLSTPIAETSLTVPGVRIVVDSGFRRAPRLDPASGLTRLVTVRISRAAANQRAGRAGRGAPGVAIRLWTEALHRGLPAADRPELLDSELSGLLLDCLAWGAEPRALAFPDAPPEGALAAARALLSDLDALDDAGRITAMGRLMARMGAHPRLARLMLSARDEAERALAADLAALIEDRDPIRDREAPADLSLRLDLLAGADHPAADRSAVARIRRTAALHRRRLSVPARATAKGDPAALLAAGFPDRIAAKRGALDGAFRLASGQGARLPATDPLAKSPLLAVADLDLQGTEARIRLAAPLSRETLGARLPERFRRTEETFFDARAGAVVSRARLRFGPLVLEDAPLPAQDAEAAGRALARAAAERGLRDLRWTEAARGLQARTLRMRALEPDSWPDLSDEALAATAETWLGPACTGRTRLTELSDVDTLALLAALLPAGGRRRLEAELPARIAFPNGRDAAIDYAADPPRVSARAQWFYGLASLPPLAGGRIPLAAELLSPAGRPMALTSDLAGFWRGGWQDARRDMRGRYPKHDWPEDPSR